MPHAVEPPADRDPDDPTLAPGWYRVRRNVKFRSFLFTGAVLGFLIGAVIAAIGPSSPRVSGGSALAFMGMVGALIGTLIGGLVAVLFDRRLDRLDERG